MAKMDKYKFRTRIRPTTLVVLIALIVTFTLEAINVMIAMNLHTLHENEGADAYTLSLGMKHKDKVNDVQSALSSSTSGPSKALMVIAAVPTSDIKFAAIWSQLECFAGDFDTIIISAPKKNFKEVQQFIKEVKDRMPAVGSRLFALYFKNLKYDTGLWCDALIEGNILNTGANENTYVGGSSEYDKFLLINDSMMAVERSNEFLEALEEQKADLVSLNYWGDKENRTSYWVESAVRAFSLEGMQTFADKVCSLGQIEWKKVCPYLSRYYYKGKPIKKCIVEKTEIEVAQHYPLDKVHGLYSGNAGNWHSWTTNFTYWAGLRDQMSFPAVKTTRNGLYKEVRKERPQDTERCTANLKKYSIQ